MNIKERIESLETQLKQTREDLQLYREMEVVFNRLKFPDGMAVYFSRYSSGDIYANFYPNYDSTNKDLTMFVHALARKFHVKFAKSKSWDKSTLEYIASFKFGLVDITVKVDGVIPAKCKVIETVRQLSDEEIEEQRQKALAKIETTKIEREIVCR